MTDYVFECGNRHVYKETKLKHGEWHCGFDIRCSCCGYKLETTGLPSECPACHAKMDGREKEE